MKVCITLAACLIAFATGSALADAPRAKPPKLITQRHQAAGKPHKASSFAPHPTHGTVFGAPIQPPIIHGAAPKKPQPQ
jgi:hypothetical protein